MKQALLLVSSCFVISINTYAQQKKLDSLLSVSASYAKEDTFKFNLLNGIANLYSNIDPVKGIATADRVIALAEKLKDKKRLASAYRNKALNYWTQNDLKKAGEIYQTAMDISVQINDKGGIARTRSGLGLVSFGLGNYQEAREYFQNALAVMIELKDTANITSCYNRIGETQKFLSDYSGALESYYKALAINEQTGNKLVASYCYADIGSVYEKIAKYPKALESYKMALSYSQMLGNKRGLGVVYMRIGVVYDDMNIPDSSLENYNKALAVFEDMNNRTGIAGVLCNIGVLYCDKLKDYEQAAANMRKAVPIFRQTGDKYNLSTGFTYLSTICIQAPAIVLGKLGIPASERYTLALKYADSALVLGKECGELGTQCNAWGLRSDIYERKNDYKNALAAYKQKIILRDSMLNGTKTQEVQQKEMQYNFDKREAATKAENDKKQVLALAEIERQKTVRNGTIGGGMLLLIAGVSSFGFYKRKRDADQAKKDAELKAQVTDTELKALRAQMNPHFIFNSLNSISDYISRNETQAADDYLTKFAKLMRMILENSEEREVPLSEDLEVLEWYMQLEALRMNHKFTYKINISEDIDPKATVIPPMILQPFVENSIWHGLSHKSDDNGHISILVKKEGAMLCCIVEDNGVGRNSAGRDTNMNRRSLGMKITQSRIDVINQQRGSNASIALTDLRQGMKAEIKLPLSQNF